ncbi:MAG: hypothetical protein HC769_25350 [Cyanobacteria bacterium CRU_2_1]|nr:hypothetical protein [Cyanobacteria bacterium CRU_2_1]
MIKIPTCKFFVDFAIGRGRPMCLPSNPGQPRRDCPNAGQPSTENEPTAIADWLLTHGKLS